MKPVNYGLKWGRAPYGLDWRAHKISDSRLVVVAFQGREYVFAHKEADGPSWAPWRALLIAIMGEPLTPDELTIFTTLTGRQRAPLEPVREFAGIIFLAVEAANPAQWAS